MNDSTTPRSRTFLPAPRRRPVGPTRRLSRFSLIAALVSLIGLLASASSAPAADCAAKPDVLIQEIDRALRGAGQGCDWDVHVASAFPNSMGGGSYNLPVLGAAIAYVREPVRSGSWNMNTWWRDYLRGELGERGPIWKYGGQELGSGNYQHANIISVMTVHYQAWQVGNGELRVLSRRWLRATFALHALSAAPQRPKTIHDRNATESFNSYVGPFVAMAGMRYSENHWRNTHRSILFARAAGIATNFKGEKAQRKAREFLEQNWAGPSGSIYGMTSTNQQFLRDVVNTGVIRPAIAAMYQGLHTVYRIHFIGWQGVRLTLIEKNGHGSTVPTYGLVYFQQSRDASGRELHLLYPWARWSGVGPRTFRNGVTAGSAAVDLLARTAWATNTPAEPPHPPEYVSINNLPTGPPQFHVVLGP
ncbi:MAG: hypothetical protein GY719_13960 [bacterium]|nr:hypothetical protein [bacterium]